MAICISYNNIKQVKIKILIILTCLFSVFTAQTQDFNDDARYKQAMKNAKTALLAEQFSQAVMFYREALSIKPDELLPKYKIEDIRTIYIKNELDSLITKVPEPIKKKKKKEIEAEQIQLKERAEEIATAKMYEEAEQEKQEIAELLIVDEPIFVDENITIEETEPDIHIPLKKVESLNINRVENNLDTHTKEIIIENRIAPEPIKQTIETTEEKPIEKKVGIKETTKKPAVSTPNKPKITEEWIKQENGKLAIKYPNKKTVEEIEKPGKHITRVIMNINQKVTIYLKVKHSWGATFYFIDEVGLEPSSISEIHFNRMTDLNTYKTD